MLLILSGPSAVGKSFCVDFLCTRYNFKSVVPFTSRPPRVTEAQGIQYHFRNREDLVALSQNLSVGYWGSPLGDEHVYGYTSELDDLIAKSHNYVIQASAELATRIKEAHDSAHSNKHLILGFLNFQNPAVLEKKLLERFGSDGYERRLAHARQEIARRGEFDFELKANDPFALAHVLVERLTQRYELELPQCLTPPLYGAMSDVDILNSANESDGLRFHNLSKEQLIDQVHGWSVDLTLGDRYWRIKPDLKEFDLAVGTDEELERRFEKCKITPGKGTVLQAGEIILSVTHEHLQLPKSIVGIFAGRTSYANIGLSIELSQIILQPGHNSPVRLQIRNNLPYAIKIYPGMRLVQAVFFRLLSPASRKYIERLEAHYKTPDDVISKYYSDPILKSLKSARLNEKPFPWSAALEIAQIAAGFSAVCAFIGLGTGQVAFAKSTAFITAILAFPIVVARLRKFRQGGWS